MRLLLTALASALVLAGLHAPTALAGGPAAARTLRCAAPASTAPLAEFRGNMRAVPGTQRMAMRFDLQERLGASPWRTVPLEVLRHWRRARPGVGAFTYVQRVENLTLEGAYRVVVHFHWVDRHGRVLKQVLRSSSACPAAEPFPGG